MQQKRDIPGLIAKWLFWLGFVWAIYLIPYTVISWLGVFIESVHWLVLSAYLLTGYAIWIGWRWRSRRPRGLKSSVIFWLGSAIFNLIYLVYTVIDSSSLLIAFAHPFCLWWSIAVLASLLAIYFEFALSRYEKQAA